MSTENPAEAQLVDYDDAEEVEMKEAPIQGEEDADARKFALPGFALWCLGDTTWA